MSFSNRLVSLPNCLAKGGLLSFVFTILKDSRTIYISNQVGIRSSIRQKMRFYSTSQDNKKGARFLPHLPVTNLKVLHAGNPTAAN